MSADELAALCELAKALRARLVARLAGGRATERTSTDVAETDYEKLSVFEQIRRGLLDSIAHSRGELTLRTTQLPAPPPAASPARVAALRRRLKMSQSVFAAALNVSPRLVQSWEQGLRTPTAAT